MSLTILSPIYRWGSIKFCCAKKAGAPALKLPQHVIIWKEAPPKEFWAIRRCLEGKIVLFRV